MATKDELLLQAKGDIIRLRARNAELTQFELDNEVLQKRLEETQVDHHYTSHCNTIFNVL